MARFEDGTGTTITLANGTTLWEVSITPPSFEGGGEIDTTTLRNTTMRTKQPKVLKELGECSFSAAYDTSHLTTLYGQVNTNAAISISFPDGASILFWGFIDSVSVGEVSEGEQPTVDVTVICTNADNSDPAVEKVPVFG